MKDDMKDKEKASDGEVAAAVGVSPAALSRYLKNRKKYEAMQEPRKELSIDGRKQMPKEDVEKERDLVRLKKGNDDDDDWDL